MQALYPGRNGLRTGVPHWFVLVTPPE